MPELFAILIKINVALVLFCAGYFLVLRKLTFYTLNRVYLVGAIVLSSIYPFVDLTAFAQRNQQLVEPMQNIVIYWQAPVQQIVEQATYWNWLEVIFWTGAAVFAGRLTLQMLSLYKIYRRSTRTEINGHKVRVVSGDIGPFSFWQSIYINPENLSAADINNILEHEQVHVKEWHTLDILLSELSIVFYWFNPGVWMMKRAVRENIEFITDRKILQKGTDSKAYQYSLLNVTFNQPAPAITSNFNFSTLKKRIIMMNAKRSSNLNLTRYALVVPVVIVSLLTLTLAKAEALKINKVFKQIAVTVEDIAPISLSADTTPVKNKQSKPEKPKTAKEEKTVGTTTQKIVSDKQEVISKAVFRGVGPNDSVVIIVNNKIQDNVNSLNNVNPNDIKSVTVIKNNPEEYLQKMTGISVQADGKIKGVISIDTKNNIFASTENSKLKEVVVVGYGTKKLPDTTSKARITIRPLNGNTEPPFIVVDGKPYEGDEDILKKIPPDNIQSMSVLKGTSATAVYGDKAKNGAIVITTKLKQ